MYMYCVCTSAAPQYTLPYVMCHAILYHDMNICHDKPHLYHTLSRLMYCNSNFKFVLIKLHVFVTMFRKF